MTTEVHIEKWDIEKQSFVPHMTRERKATDYYMLHTWAHYQSVSAAKHSEYRVSAKLINEGKVRLSFTVGTNNPDWAVNN
jgi:hypothetical protein